MARINNFQNLETLHDATGTININVGTLKIHGIFIPGSLSFNLAAHIIQFSGTGSKTLSISLGLYSLNGSTLSLANSASLSNSSTTSGLSWVTFVTSATQDITPGNWYLGYLGSSSGTGNILPVEAIRNITIGIGNQSGKFVRGYLSASTAGLPTSIATSDIDLEGGTTSFTFRYPYILISA